jgi:hypothetical protein
MFHRLNFIAHSKRMHKVIKNELPIFRIQLHVTATVRSSIQNVYLFMDYITTHNLRSYLEEIVAAPGLENRSYGRRDSLRWPRETLYPLKLALASLTLRRSLDRYSSLADSNPRSFFVLHHDSFNYSCRIQLLNVGARLENRTSQTWVPNDWPKGTGPDV